MLVSISPTEYDVNYTSDKRKIEWRNSEKIIDFFKQQLVREEIWFWVFFSILFFLGYFLSSKTKYVCVYK